MNKEYYLPINSANISRYFSKGLILPSIYISDWINDIQSKYDNLILLCSKPFTDETDCSLTIAFSNDELREIDSISENFSVYSKPLPIARVKSLNFKEKEKSEITVYNIEKGDAFIPKLISILEKIEVVDVSELNSAKNINYMQDWKEKINIYNQILGGFAIMRIADFPNKDYSRNFFKSLSLINKEIKEQIKEFSFKNDYKIDILNSSAYKKINTAFVTNYAKNKEGFNLPTKRGLIKFDEIDENKKSYILSILATYGSDNGKIKKISDFFSALLNGSFHHKSREKLCLTFGLNQGYSAFRNQYNINNVKINTKFELNSEVDYSIIESVYQYVFNNKTNNTSFPYINKWCPKYQNTVDLHKYETYRIFDKDIIYKKKAQLGSPEYLQELFQRFSKNSLLLSIFNIDKGDFTNSIKNIIDSIYKKIKLDIELAKSEKGNNSIKYIELQEQINKLKKENNNLSIQLKQLSNNENFDKIKENSRINNEFNIEVDKKAVIIKRKETLTRITAIGELKGIAKYYNIKSLSRFKNNNDDKETLRKLITEKEEQIYNS